MGQETDSEGSIYHAILNVFNDNDEDGHVLGTMDIVEEVNFSKHETIQALEEMENHGGIYRKRIGRAWAWWLVGGCGGDPNNPHLRDLASVLTEREE